MGKNPNSKDPFFLAPCQADSVASISGSREVYCWDLWAQPTEEEACSTGLLTGLLGSFAFFVFVVGTFFESLSNGKSHPLSKLVVHGGNPFKMDGIRFQIPASGSGLLKSKSQSKHQALYQSAPGVRRKAAAKRQTKIPFVEIQSRSYGPSTGP